MHPFHDLYTQIARADLKTNALTRNGLLVKFSLIKVGSYPLIMQLKNIIYAQSHGRA